MRLKRLQNQLFSSMLVAGNERESLQHQCVTVLFKEEVSLLLDVAADILDNAHTLQYYHFADKRL